MNTRESQCILVTGAARSGKSEWAESLALTAEQRGQQVVYVATSVADPDDAEWQVRLERHRQRRPPSWNCIDGPVDLVAILTEADVHTCLLVDSLGTWLTHLLEQTDDEWDQTMELVLTTVAKAKATIIFVAEEVGWGVVPAYPVGRTFRDRLGQLTRNLGAIAFPVYLVTAGHILNLSQLGTPLPSTHPS
ncbi:MAG: bifunctional adenosylcobinamide kinase/adenosylcobinamide-phosphate guanylyltransferase [Cyanothece sp. SIO2G6]|nr:bifunctional adenosylcobinamide kinase/adenosylcobinamide-phosphate guanylyltransferase [Cyanothece sp. SIO2G6]